MSKVKVVLDADVIIHFAKGGYLSMLPEILVEYDFIVLDIVYGELKGDVKMQLDNQMKFLKNIELFSFNNLFISFAQNSSGKFLVSKFI